MPGRGRGGLLGRNFGTVTRIDISHSFNFPSSPAAATKRWSAMCVSTFNRFHTLGMVSHQKCMIFVWTQTQFERRFTFSVAISTSFSLKVAFSFLQLEGFHEEQKIRLQLWCLFTCYWCWLLFHLYLMLVASSAKPFAALEMSVSTTGFTSFAFKVSKSEQYEFWMKLRSLWIISCFMCFPKDGSVLSSGLTIVTHVTQM